jgi:hypothetical protein
MCKWTDEQLQKVLFSFYQADGGCCYCVRECLGEFIEQNGNDSNLLKRMKALHDMGAYQFRAQELDPIF